MKGFYLWGGFPLLLLLHAAADEMTSSLSASLSASPPAASALNTESTILTTSITTPLELENSSSAVMSKETISSAMSRTLTSSTGMGPTSQGTPSTASVMQNPTDIITINRTKGPCINALGGGTCILVSRSLLLGLLFCTLLTNMKH